MRRLHNRLFSAALVLLVSGCGPGKVAQSANAAPVIPVDPRAAAISKAIDSQSGARILHCDPSEVKQVPRTTVRSKGLDCWIVSGQTTIRLTQVQTPFGVVYNVPVGHFVVDKIGEEQSGFGGITLVPYRGHFVISDFGKKFVARQRFTPPDATGKAHLEKDADGNWVAEL